MSAHYLFIICPSFAARSLPFLYSCFYFHADWSSNLSNEFVAFCAIHRLLTMQRNEQGDKLKKHPVLLPKANHSSVPTTTTIGHTRQTDSSQPSRRSRHGCRTCKVRKVKCEEGRPICKQCIRLELSCDYNIRVSFRDDTKRICSQMAGVVNLDGNPVWNSQHRYSSQTLHGKWVSKKSPTLKDESLSETADELGPFATLTTDEDRECKAEAALPGAYFVVVNSDSFLRPSHHNDDPDRRVSARRHRLRAVSLANIMGKVLITPVPGDPDIVLLRQFDGSKQRLRKTASWSISPAMSKIKLEDFDLPEETEQEVSLTLQEVIVGNGEIYLQQFRDTVWKQLLQWEVEMMETIASPSLILGEIECAATNYPPASLCHSRMNQADVLQLFHAMLAIGALGLSQGNSKERVDASQHCEQSISALQIQGQDAQDLSTDDIFLTIFLLLNYEVCTNILTRMFLTLLDLGRRFWSPQNVVILCVHPPSHFQVPSRDLWRTLPPHYLVDLQY